MVACAEARDDLLAALAHMPAMYRTAVVLHDAQGMTSAQVGDVMESGVAAAKQRIRRGRMMPVTALADAGGEADPDGSADALLAGPGAGQGLPRW